MGKATKRWAKNARRRLMVRLAVFQGLPEPACFCCGATIELTFDCIDPIDGERHHRMSTDQRMVFYRRQHYTFDNVQILCDRCNSRKADARVDYRNTLFWPKKMEPF